MSTNGTQQTAALAAPAPRVLANPDDAELSTIERMGDLLARSGFARGARSKEQAVALILMGRELGIPAMTALSTIYVIDGRPAASVHLIGGQLARGGVRWELKAHTDTECVIEFRRSGWEPMQTRFTMQDAQRAGVAGKDVWKRYPRAMLYARAFTEGARMIGPDLLCGVQYTPEEVGAPVNADGEPIEAAASHVPDPAVDSPAPEPEPQVAPAEDSPRLREALLGLDVIEDKDALVDHYRRNYHGKTPKQIGLANGEGARLNDALTKAARAFGIPGLAGLKRLANEADHPSESLPEQE